MGNLRTNYHSREELFSGAIAPDGRRNELFRNVSYARGDLHGYLTGVLVKYKATFDPGVSETDMTQAQVWNLVKTLSLRGLGHEWLSNTPASLICYMNQQDETNNAYKYEEFPISSFGFSVEEAAQGDLEFAILIPIAPKLFSSGLRGKGAKDGLFPLAAMGDRGEFTIKLGGEDDIPDDWDFDGSPTITVDLFTYWTEDAIISQPWRLDHQESSDSVVQFSRRPGKCDLLTVGNPDVAEAYTVPKVDIKLEVDGLTIFDDMSGEDINFMQSIRRTDNGITHWIPQPYLGVILPTESGSMFDLLWGTLFKIHDADPGGGKKSVYTIRRYLDLTEQQVRDMEKVLKIPPGSATDTNGTTISGRPEKAYRRGQPELSGANRRVD